jgi:Tfp pilus assembly protein PilF
LPLSGALRRVPAACRLPPAACRLQRGEFVRARALCSRVLRRDPRAAKAWYRRAQAKLRLKVSSASARVGARSREAGLTLTL